MSALASLLLRPTDEVSDPAGIEGTGGLLLGLGAVVVALVVAVAISRHLESRRSRLHRPDEESLDEGEEK